MNNDELKELLRQHKLKATDIRLQVLNVMIQSDVALSHSDIKDKVPEEDVDKVTLYRTLNSFTEKGLAHKVATEDRSWLYAVHLKNNTSSKFEITPDSEHAHFICDNCERIYCFPFDSGGNNVSLSNTKGYTINSYEIRLHGLCPDCTPQN